MADDSRKRICGGTRTCPVCGRQFWCYEPMHWAYRERTRQARQICSWSCQVKHNAEQDAKRDRRKKYQIEAEPVKPAAPEPQRRIISKKKCVPKPTKKKVGYHWIANLGQIMKAKGVSERDLAERTGIRRATIGQWRRADTRCPDYKIDILADALGVSRAELQLCDDQPDVEPVKREPKQKPPPKEWYWLVNLAEIMQEKGISNRSLSRCSGFPGETIGQWRRMKTQCQGYKLDILAEALGVTREAITERKTAPRDGSDHTMPESDGNTDD